MVVIIKKDGGKVVYNNINFTEEEKNRAHKLDEVLALLGPEIEKKWEDRMESGKGRKINMRIAHQIGKLLSEVVDNKKLVSHNERQWVWKALREMHFKKRMIIERGNTRDDLEHLYRLSKYPLKFVKNISWDGWRKLFESTSVRQDERFEKWFQGKTSKWDMVPRGFIRDFTKALFFLVKNKDTTVLSDVEIFKIYESAWDSARKKYLSQRLGV
jgi:hypothetical protein